MAQEDSADLIKRLHDGAAKLDAFSAFMRNVARCLRAGITANDLLAHLTYMVPADTAEESKTEPANPPPATERIN
jgi:hypothetical protein